MIFICKNLSNHLLLINTYFWILDYTSKYTYFAINMYYKLLDNRNIFIKNIEYFVKYIYNKSFIKLNQLNYFKNKFKLISVSLKLVGIGYKIIKLSNKNIKIYIGYSHSIHILLPETIFYTINTDHNCMTIMSYDKILLYNIIYKLKKLKKLNPYKENGFKFADEIFVSKNYKK